jgi:hypothetical protein
LLTLFLRAPLPLQHAFQLLPLSLSLPAFEMCVTSKICYAFYAISCMAWNAVPDSLKRFSGVASRFARAGSALNNHQAETIQFQ